MSDHRNSFCYEETKEDSLLCKRRFFNSCDQLDCDEFFWSTSICDQWRYSIGCRCDVETVSGFTTTGSSILTDVEALARCSLFWRSFTHWVGGMGVFVFVLAVMPLVGGQNIHLMRAESPGPSVGKLVPKIRKTSMILYKIYIFMTIVMVVLLLLGKLPLFDSAVTCIRYCWNWRILDIEFRVCILLTIHTIFDRDLYDLIWSKF